MRSVVVVLLLVGVLTGCTDSGRRDGTGACLLDATEVAGIIHAKVEAGSPSSGMRPTPGLALCTYSTDAPFGEVTVAVQRPGQTAFREAESGARLRATVSPPFASLDALGDGAFSIGGTVHVLQQDSHLTVAAQNPTDAFVPVARQLAKQALRNLA